MYYYLIIAASYNVSIKNQLDALFITKDFI